MSTWTFSFPSLDSLCRSRSNEPDQVGIQVQADDAFQFIDAYLQGGSFLLKAREAVAAVLHNPGVGLIVLADADVCGPMEEDGLEEGLGHGDGFAGDVGYPVALIRVDAPGHNPAITRPPAPAAERVPPARHGDCQCNRPPSSPERL